MEYTLGQVAALLGISPRQLTEWIARANINVMLDTIDRRRRLLTSEQVLLLAHLYRRTNEPGSGRLAGASQSPVTVASLDDVRALEVQEVQLERRLEQMRQAIHRHRERLASLDGALNETEERIDEVERTVDHLGAVTNDRPAHRSGGIGGSREGRATDEMAS